MIHYHFKCKIDWQQLWSKYCVATRSNLLKIIIFKLGTLNLFLKLAVVVKSPQVLLMHT